MSRSSPGRYATHEFAKNIYKVTASDKAGNILTVNQPDGNIFQVIGNHDFIELQYTLFANYGDGTHADIDESSVLLNMPASFIWLKGAEKWPVTIHFNLPAAKHWSIATQLPQADDSLSFSAPDLQYFMDSPVLLGELSWYTWKVKNRDDKTYLFRLALNTGASQSFSQTAFSSFGRKLEKLVQEAMSVFQTFPDFDYGTYTFLASINPFVKGDGMEHRNSTVLTYPVTFTGDDWLLKTFAHEFFHSWNVERIRPASLEPFNLEKSNISESLWFAEGFTQYYGELIMRRAGFSTNKNFEDNASTWINTKENTPAGKAFSPLQMSRMAVFTDAGISIDRNNYANNYANYYSIGAAIALALDLELKTKYNLSLDDLMVAAWKIFGKRERTYTVNGLKEALIQVTVDTAFSNTFFSHYVYGHKSYDYTTALKKLGYQITNSDKTPWIGNVSFSESNNGVVINSNTTIGSPLYEAGIDIDDELLSIDAIPVKSAIILPQILEAYKVGEKVTLEYRHRGLLKTTIIILGENPSLKMVSYEQSGLPVPPAILKLRNAWFGSRQ